MSIDSNMEGWEEARLVEWYQGRGFGRFCDGLNGHQHDLRKRCERCAREHGQKRTWFPPRGRLDGSDHRDIRRGKEDVGRKVIAE